MNPIIKYVAIAGILLLGACGSGNVNDANDLLNGGAGFSARTFNVPSNFTQRIDDIRIDRDGSQLRSIAHEYLESISFEFHTEESFWVSTTTSPNKTGEILFITVIDEVDRLHLTPPLPSAFGAHSFVGILDTNVGAPLEINEAKANIFFGGNFRHLVTVSPSGRGKEFESYGGYGSINLTVDFNERTLTGMGRIWVSNRHPLEVKGQFSEGSNILSGSVSVTYIDIDRTFTAPLTGHIGVNGAIGVFSNYENTGDVEGYAFGGGFVVDNCELAVNYVVACP